MTESNVLFDAPGPRARRRHLVFSLVFGVLILVGLAWMIFILAEPRLTRSGIVLPGMFAESRWDIFSDPQVWYFIAQGAWSTLRAALVASVCALTLGVLFSLLRSASARWLRVVTAAVLEFFRGMPVLLMMLFILLIGATGQFWAVVLALSVYNGAIIGEALRAGLASLPRGQREAGLSLGMRPLRAKLQIEFPQAFRQTLPVIVAQLVVLLKDTSLGYIVGYNELLRTTLNNLASFYGNNYLFSLYVITLGIYLAMNLSLSWFARWLARRSDPSRRHRDVDPAQEILAASAVADARGRA